MLFTITYSGSRTQELGYLLYKNPYRPQTFELNLGKAHVFYPQVSDGRTTAALLLDIDPIDLARGKVGASGGGLFEYVNDRPYVSSSFLSTAISRVFGTALTGRADKHQALSDTPLALEATVTMLPCRGDKEMLAWVFEPLGYAVEVESFLSDERFPAWGESKYVNLTLRGTVRLRDLLKHVYVLLPVFDRQKHYWVGPSEVDKLLRMGEDWLPQHPEKNFITARYLNWRRPLISLALSRLAEAEDELSAPGEAGETAEIREKTPGKALETEETEEKRLSLNEQRLGSVLAALKSCGAASVLDLGCGEGRLLELLVKERQFTRIAGMDVSSQALGWAAERLHLEEAGDRMRERIKLFQSSLTYQDARLEGYDAACVVEVVEHMDLPRLSALERVMFEFAKPKTVVLTTPNREYNARYGGLPENGLRHGDHRFEWTRAEFRAWAESVAGRFGYGVRFSDVGEADAELGAPTQMGVFSL